MNDNPYTPPESEVKDAPYERAVAQSPRNIVHAVRMLWGSLVLSIPISIREYQDAASEGNAACRANRRRRSAEALPWQTVYG